MKNNRVFYFIIIGFLIYIAVNFSMSNYSQERYRNEPKWLDSIHPIYHVTTPNTNSIYSSNFRSNLPVKNIKFRPENELGNISSDHLVYDT